MKRKIVSVVLVVALTLAVIVPAGCTPAARQSASEWLTSNETATRIIVKGVLSEYFNKNRGSSGVVYEWANNALLFVQSSSLPSTITVDMLNKYVQDTLGPQITKLTPAGQVAAEELIALIEDQLVKQLPLNGVPEAGQTKVVISAFLTWVKDVAYIYSQQKAMADHLTIVAMNSEASPYVKAAMLVMIETAEEHNIQAALDRI